jgi:hypothetical protein
MAAAGASCATFGNGLLRRQLRANQSSQARQAVTYLFILLILWIFFIAFIAELIIVKGIVIHVVLSGFLPVIQLAGDEIFSRRAFIFLGDSLKTVQKFCAGAEQAPFMAASFKFTQFEQLYLIAEPLHRFDRLYSAALDPV